MDKDMEKINNEELVEVTGGGAYDGNQYYFFPGDRKSDPCKHCGAVDSLAFNRKGIGWEIDPCKCNIFRCEKCGQDSYYSIWDDHLIQ